MSKLEEVVDEIARYNSMDALEREYVREQIGKRLSEILEIHKAEQQEPTIEEYEALKRKLHEVERSAREKIEALEQEPRKGHWVHGEYCSECGCDVPAYIIDWKWQKDMDAKYCPNCGCRMVEPQESEDKE